MLLLRPDVRNPWKASQACRAQANTGCETPCSLLGVTPHSPAGVKLCLPSPSMGEGYEGL